MGPRKQKSNPESDAPRASKRKKPEASDAPTKPAVDRVVLLVPQGWLKWLGYLCAFFPPCGFALGVVYYSQPDPKAKRFGQYCMVIAGLGLIALCFCWGISGLSKVIGGSESTGLVGGYF
jgi:hypothetical protein